MASGDRQPPPASPAPKRRRRWPYVLLGVLLLLGALAAWRYRVLAQEEDRLAQLVAEIRRRGEPIEWQDFRPEPAAPERNAPGLYKQAVRLVRGEFNMGAPEPTIPDPNAEHRADLLALLRDDVVLHPGLRARRPQGVREILVLARQALSLCRQARQRDGADWGLRYSGPAVYCRLPDMSDLTVLSALLALAALAAQEEGRSADAVEYLRDALALAESIETMGVLVSFVVAANIREIVCTAVEQIAPDLSGDSGAPQLRPAVRRLIDDLLRPDRFPRAMLAERSQVYDTAERVRSGEIPLNTLTTWPGSGPLAAIRKFRLGMLAPSFHVSDEIDLLEAMSRHVAAAKAATYPAARAALRTPGAASAAADRGPLAKVLWPSYGRIYKVRHRALARRRMAATALALRLYTWDNERRPEKLSELVPNYLPAVPADPFSAAARPIRYVPDAERPLLYSVFKNARDDGGEFTIGSRGYLDLVDSPDLVFFLTGGRPVPKLPATVPSSRPRPGVP